MFVHIPASVDGVEIDLRDLFDQIDINNAFTINHIVLFFSVEESTYHLQKTRRGINAVTLNDDKI